jgi:membrane-associated phospholipid phosphatase
MWQTWPSAPLARLVAAMRTRARALARGSGLALLAALIAALMHLPAIGQTEEGSGDALETVPVEPQTLGADLKAFVTAPADWRARDWLKFSGVVAAVGVAYRYDDEVRARYANDGEPNYHEVIDSMPAAVTFGGMWFAAKLARSEQALWEVRAMRRAIVIQTISTEVLKVAFRRERPGPGVPKDDWNARGLSFPSGHTAVAFAIGTVLAESGDDRHRAWRRAIGYGIGVATAYQRVNHDAHWLSDTVAGAALGIAAAKFVMKRRSASEPRGQVWLGTVDGGPMLTFAMPLR